MQQVRTFEYAEDPGFENASLLLSLIPPPENMMYRDGLSLERAAATRGTSP